MTIASEEVVETLYEDDCVALVGAGLSGILATKYMKEVGLKPITFEKGSDIGGLWNFETDSCLVYEGLKMNTSKYMTEFSDFKVKEGLPEMPSIDDFMSYLRAYIDHFNLNECFRFNSEVMELSYSPEKGRYIVSYRSAEGVTRKGSFKYAICCGGQFSIPIVPKLPSIETFEGTIFHSSTYKGEKPWEAYKGKKVLVVGSAVSGPDIASSLAENGIEATCCFRTPKYFFGFEDFDGKAVDFDTVNQFSVILDKYLSEEQMNEGFKQLCLNTIGAPESFGALKPDETLKGNVCPVVQFLRDLKDGKVGVKPGIEKVKSKSVVFADGSEEGFDAIILATGYKLNLDFLSPDIRAMIEPNRETYNNGWPKCYLNTVHPDLPNFAVIGYGIYISPVILNSEMQSMFVSQVFTGKHELPPTEMMLKSIKEHVEWAAEPHHRFCMIGPFVNSLAEAIGASPSCEEHPELAKAFLFGPIFTCRFRISGPFATPGSVERFKDLLRSTHRTDLLEKSKPDPRVQPLIPLILGSEDVSQELKPLLESWSSLLATK
eukprot:Nk52_evm30s164 gene=Nk52_evmTU30s164